jgi:hypothetical protein
MKARSQLTHAMPWFLLAFSLGCASRQEPPATASQASAAAPGGCDERQDQSAIAAMAGSYDVVFDFEETEALSPGYRKLPSHKSFATELVVLLENTPGRVSLQHILVVGSGPRGVIKHWRQDWAFENRELLEYQGRDVWSRRRLPASVAHCNWTQAVYGVDDGPRYSGYGRFTHDANGSVWQSNPTWRPLPRREYTTRHDYDVLVGVNRHRITATGWDHEQDNEKLVLEPRHSLVRERGLNRYTRTKPSETQAAAEYWLETAPFWQQVREAWASLLASHTRLSLQTEANGKPLHEPLFERALTQPAADSASESAFIQQAVGSYVIDDGK